VAVKRGLGGVAFRHFPYMSGKSHHGRREIEGAKKLPLLLLLQRARN